jgi:hypothetical protein
MLNKESIIYKPTYHDSEIIEIKYIDNDLILKISDGWNVGQINEFIFMNGKENSKYDLLNRVIYQIDDIVYSDGLYNLSLLVWMKELDGMLLEKVSFEAQDITLSVYDNDELIMKKSLTEEMGG